jgi:tungstate transport system ATP-binding protein
VNEPLIALQNVALRFGRFEALHDVSLEVRAGERIALVGANGSGKSTLLRVLHGLLAPSVGVRRESMVLPSDGARRESTVVTGNALPCDQVRAAGPRPLRLAMLFQRPFLLRLSVESNVRVGLWLAGVRGDAARARCTEALQRVGLSAEAKRPARALSGGQQQRLALARAWALQPDVLLVDEPTASLDPHAKREVEALLDEVAAQGITLLMASHQLGQVRRLARRVVYLDQGQVRADLPVNQFFDGDVPDEARLFLKGELPW